MKTVIQRTPDIDPNLLHETICDMHPDWRGTPDPMGWSDPLTHLQWDPVTNEITIDHPDADLSAAIKAARGRQRPKTKREQAEVSLRDLRQKAHRSDLDHEALQNALIDYLLP